MCFFFSSRRRHTRFKCDWSSDVCSSDLVTLPATTTAFEAANIFARTSGYIEKRYVDIGDQVKAGALRAHITAPEIHHQITQTKGTPTHIPATLQQTPASRDLSQYTNPRDTNLCPTRSLP